MSRRHSAGETGASAEGTAGEHGPLAPDEIAMPAQQGLGTGEEADPGRAGQVSAETCECQTISRPPARPLDPALEVAQLVPDDQELEAEAGVRASAIDEGIEEQTEDGNRGEREARSGIVAGWILSYRRARRYRVQSFLTAHSGLEQR